MNVQLIPSYKDPRRRSQAISHLAKPPSTSTDFFPYLGKPSVSYCTFYSLPHLELGQVCRDMSGFPRFEESPLEIQEIIIEWAMRAERCFDNEVCEKHGEGKHFGRIVFVIAPKRNGDSRTAIIPSDLVVYPPSVTRLIACS